MNSWTCNGKTKDGKKYRNKHRPGSHPPVENFGSACIECGLKKQQVFGESPVKVILVAAVAGLSCIILWVIIDIISTPPGLGNYRYFKDVPNVPEMEVRYGGSTSFAPLRSPEIVAKIEQVHPGFTLSYVEPIPPEKPGSGSGIGRLIEGQLSVAQSSRPLQEEELAQASDRGFTLEQVPVAIDSIAIYINPQISVSSLTLAQLKDIFTGKITNWKEVGGADLPIIPVSRDPKDGGTPEFFKEEVMAGEPLAVAAQPYSRDTTAALRKVGSTPGAIGYGSAPEVCPQKTISKLRIAREAGQSPVAACNGLQVNKADLAADLAKDAYPITRRLFVIIRQDGRLDEQAGLAYANLFLSKEGQTIIQEKDFIPIRTIPARN